MFTHLFKLIWNKKKQNFLLLCEMLISFMVMFAVLTMMVNYYHNYKKSMGFKYENVWSINFYNPDDNKNTDSILVFYQSVRNVLTSMPQIKELSFTSGNTPFSDNTSTTGFSYKNKKFAPINTYQVEDDYKSVFQMELLEGRWFGKEDNAAATRPIVINQSLREQIFGKGKAIGQVVGGDKKKEDGMRIIGVVADMKDKGDYRPSGMALFNRIDTSFFRYAGQIVIRVSPQASAAFEGHLYQTITAAMPKASIQIEHLTKKRENTNRQTLTPLIIFTIIAGFLILNVALGLFGVLWYNINKRRGEIGLRRAIGASGASVSMQIVTESMFLATLSLIIGTFFAIQFPLLNVFDLPASVYITAMFLAVLFIYLLVFVCSLYPGRQAAAVYPAVALHEE